MRRREGDVSGKVVVVTGGARGIGAAVARDLAGRGARVAIGDLDADAAERTALSLDGGAVGLALDVTDDGSFTSFLDRVERRLGPIDVLVSNAGVMWVGPFAEEPPEVTRRQFDVNVIGVITGIRSVAPGMRARGGGHLVTIASAASRLTPRGEAAYAATKHAVHGYCSAVQAELHGSGVRVSVVMPTVVATELAAGTSPGLIRMLTPERVAEGVWTAIRTGRRDVYVPASIGLLTRLLAVLPQHLSVPLGRLMVPNQLRRADRTRRRAYESTL